MSIHPIQNCTSVIFAEFVRWTKYSRRGIHREKYRFKVREGFSLDSLRLPKMIFETPSPLGKVDENYIREAIDYFKKMLFKEDENTGYSTSTLKVEKKT